MDKASIIGVILGFIAVFVGMVLKGVSLAALVNPAALLIIFVGTIAAVMIATPMRVVKTIPQLFKIIFTEKNGWEIKDLVVLFKEWGVLTRREGLLSLESEVNGIDDPFLSAGLQMAIDGQNPDYIRDVLMEKIYAMEERHAEGAKVFSQAGTYAPTLGVLGAVVGLVAALGSMDNMDILGLAISSAFIATLFGIFTGYVLWHPFANKLQEKSKYEAKIKAIMIEGILAITIGESPNVIEEKLYSYLPTKEIEKLKAEQEDMKRNEEEETE